MPWYGAKIQLQLDENVWLVMDDQKQAIIQELSRQLQIILSCHPYHTTVSF
jgi:phenylpyruvate tautomerase PptA (4-oxalocrotonate tautomerase family)